jgi:hypothetical protein
MDIVLDCPKEKVGDGCISKYLMEVIREIRKTDISTPFDPIDLINYIKNIKSDGQLDIDMINGIEDGFYPKHAISFFSSKCKALAETLSTPLIEKQVLECRKCKTKSCDISSRDFASICFSKERYLINECFKLASGPSIEYCNICRERKLCVKEYSTLPNVLFVGIGTEDDVELSGAQFRDRVAYFADVRYEVKAVILLTGGDGSHYSVALFDDGLSGKVILADDTRVEIVSDTVLKNAYMLACKRVDLK